MSTNSNIPSSPPKPSIPDTNTPPPQLSKGRRKVEIKKIENKLNRSVTFSKRCKGLMKKAEELGSLTGSQVGLIVFSPGGKPFSYGNPSIESILTRHLFGSSSSTAAAAITNIPNLEEGCSRRTAELHERLMMVNAAIEEEDRRVKEIETKLMKEEGRKIEEMEERELVEMMMKMESLKKEIVMQIEKIKEGGGSEVVVKNEVEVMGMRGGEVVYDPVAPVSRVEIGGSAATVSTDFYHQYPPVSGAAVSFQSGGGGGGVSSVNNNVAVPAEVGNWVFKNNCINGQFGYN